MTRRRRTGISLLEVSLAIALSVGLIGAVLAFYHHVSSVRRNLVSQTTAISAQRLVMDRMSNELRNAMVYPFLRLGMEGSTNQVAIISASLPGEAAWAIRKTTEDAIPPEQDMQFVSYRLRVVEDEDGAMIVEGLERTCQKILAVETAEEGKEIQVAFLTPHVKFLRLRYYGEGGWIESWSGGDLPLAVELTIGAQPLPDEVSPEEYPYNTFRRIMYVPGGRRALSGTVIRGLDGGGS